MRGLNFEFDPQKAAQNLAKHGVSFEEAASVFKDNWALSKPDSQHSQMEERWILLGVSDFGRLLVVAYTHREQNTRIISAREATRAERRDYENG